MRVAIAASVFVGVLRPVYASGQHQRNYALVTQRIREIRSDPIRQQAGAFIGELKTLLALVVGDEEAIREGCDRITTFKT